MMLTRGHGDHGTIPPRGWERQALPPGIQRRRRRRPGRGAVRGQPGPAARTRPARARAGEDGQPAPGVLARPQ
eukprot:8337778-Pyramimonas_sp.AAC.1